MSTPIKKTPIKNRIGGVFLPVRDLEKAKNWYSKMLGLEGGEIYFGHIYTAPMDGTAGLILDTMPKWRDKNGNISTYQVPSIQFLTDDIYASYQFLKENNVELITDIEDEFYFVFKDPDGNLLMICKDLS
ncbi:VOC family protein [Metabacillus bambusae]|uniref:VOC family protein n=1 Tax=Metabacillus bambusae TaxID=2795218 RepID=A0ABS3MYZ5_9BACI|nr:VOC family protein [Metabacillus bambusae]MBO1511242.1 VOC family protein [Metabacillus bambusae]